MICPNQSNRGPLEKEEEEEEKSDSLPPADLSGPVEKKSHNNNNLTNINYYNKTITITIITIIGIKHNDSII